MEKFLVDLSFLLVGSAFLAYLAVLLKQPIVIAYILCGILVGPWGFGWIAHVEFIESISHLGITLLLYLAGLCLHPQKLIGLFKSTSLVTFISCLFSFIVAFGFSLLFHFTVVESLCVGLSLMFSSTILVVKLLPTTKLHQRRMGAICISILILQDLLAVAVLAFIQCLDARGGNFLNFGLLFLNLVLLVGVLFLLERFVLVKIMSQVEHIHEVIFILGLAWCFGIASISHKMGLFYETGAFFAGVVMARHKISFFISERLKPLRDFFLVLFFFSLGANLNLSILKEVIIYALLLSIVFIIVKPLVFRRLFIFTGEEKPFSNELGFRLGQLSEFSLLIAILAFDLGHISLRASQFIQLTTILTFVLSSYIVVYTFPTPIGTSENLNRD